MLQYLIYICYFKFIEPSLTVDGLKRWNNIYKYTIYTKCSISLLSKKYLEAVL